MTYRRLLRRLDKALARNRTTVVFANTRAFTEKITHDLRQTLGPGVGHETIAAHHSALDARRRREVEAALKSGQLRAVVTSTSLELGVDIGTADLTVMVGLPGGVSRCLQRVGRSGHQVGVGSVGLLLAATPAELAGAVVTAKAAREGRVEPLRAIQAPLDVLCQQLIGLACEGEWSADDAFALVKKAGPMETLSRADFDSCLSFLAGDLASPPGAFEPEPGAAPRWTAPRIWRQGGFFGVRNGRVSRWLRSNIGTITSEESVRVMADGVEIGTLEGAYAERLQPGDRFVLDGRSLEFRRLEGLTVHARAGGGEPSLPRWSSDRQSLTSELAREVAHFRDEAARRLDDGPGALLGWLVESHFLDPDSAAVLVALFEGQERLSEVPAPGTLLVEESPHDEGLTYTFHAPLSRSACEALGRATAARLGRRFGRDLALTVADLGWSVRLPDGALLRADEIAPLLEPDDFDSAVLEGLDRGDLPARRFRHVAGTALMVLRNPEGGRRRVGGLLWVSTRLYPLVRAACPDHPLLRETRREVLEDVLDAPAAVAWLAGRPAIRFRALDGLSPVRRRLDRTRLGRSSAVRVARRGAPASPRPARDGRSHVRSPALNPAGLLPGPGGWLLAPEGGAIHLAERTVVIADVHLGYEWARASGGDCVPAHSLAETIALLARLLARAPITRLVVAGDLVESWRPCLRTARDVSALTRWLTERGVDLLPLAGNHDPPRRPPWPSTVEIDGWTVGHGHRPMVGPRTISGHHHPMLRAEGVSAPCFLVNESSIVLPAFSPNAAGVGLTSLAPSVTADRRCVASADGLLLDFGPVSRLVSAIR